MTSELNSITIFLLRKFWFKLHHGSYNHLVSEILLRLVFTYHILGEKQPFYFKLYAHIATLIHLPHIKSIMLNFM